MNWQPMMEPGEADRWAASSALAGPWYHGTDLNSGSDLLTKGFDPRGGKGQKVYGPGLYLTDDLSQAARYGEFPVEVRINVRRDRIKTLPSRSYGDDPDLPPSGSYDALVIPPHWCVVTEPQFVTVVAVHPFGRAASLGQFLPEGFVLREGVVLPRTPRGHTLMSSRA